MNSIDFKDEEAVREYLDRLAIEYRFQCFHEDRPDGCHRLGDWLEFSKKDFPKAARIFKSNCDLHQYAQSCFKYGNYAFVGRGMKDKDEVLAAEYYKRGCDAKEPYASACYNYGFALDKGAGSFKSDPVEARRYFEKGCFLNDKASCERAFASYIRDEASRDPEKAIVFARKGCELDDYVSCANLSRMYKKGDGVEACDETAALFKNKAKKILEEMTETKPGVTFGQ